jgi:hypothetical protein
LKINIRANLLVKVFALGGVFFMTRGLSFTNGKLEITEEWSEKWSSLIRRARTSGEKYDRVCDVAREFGFAAGDVMKAEPPESKVPLYAFALGVIGCKDGKEGSAMMVFNDAGRMMFSLMLATLDPFDLPKDNTAFLNAFAEGMRDRVDAV